MNNDLKISICGDVCSECPRYKATQANDTAKLNELAELWFKLGFRTEVVSADDIKCNGCSKTKFCSYNINSCEQIRHLNNCGECDYFLCEKINSVFERTEAIDEICKEKCTVDEYRSLCTAFLRKREVLSEINQHRNRKS